MGMNKSASAYYVKLNLDAAGITGSTNDGNNLTGDFKQLQFNVETTSTINAPAPYTGATFSDVGDMYITQLIDQGNPDDEGLNDTQNGWELTGHWNDLTGIITGAVTYTDPYNKTHTTYYFDYQQGTLNLFADSPVGYNYGPTFSAEDDLTSEFIDGTQVAQLRLLDGTGTITFDSAGNFEEGAVHLNWQFESMLPGFWLEASTGKDINDYVLASNWYVVADTDSNTDGYSVRTDGQTYFKIDSNHDGSMEMKPIPEPTTLLLLGTGLLGIASIRRKRKK